jgi:selenocysteine lyase/cysteine desulfurase
MSGDEFTSVLRALREAIGTLINGPPPDIILGNSASYGLDLVARGLN